MSDDFVENSLGIQKILVDGRVYSTSAVMKTAYWFTGKCYLHIEHEGDRLAVRLKPKTTLPLHNLAEEFMNELLDQSLRERISSETEALRNVIIAHALSKTCLVAPELETAEPFADPNAISVPDGLNRTRPS